MKRIYFTVTNDLRYDQRMNRICTTLAANGYAVTLVGRRMPGSPPLQEEKYRQKRLRCFFNRGKMFYAEYNIRLFFWLLFRRMDAICAVDLDTILPCLVISRLKRIPRVYDAHELFTGLKEVATRPGVLKFWTWVERTAVPKFKWGYTVSESIAEEFGRRYGVKYAVIRNLPRLRQLDQLQTGGSYLLYQGAVNEARAFEDLIPALRSVDQKLVVCGDGNFMARLRQLILENGLESKVELKGMLPPEQLWEIARGASIGLGVAENTGINQFLALPNKFFDYIQAGLPQVTMNFPEYRKINSQFEIAVLLDDTNPERIAGALNKLLQDRVLYERLRMNCLKARMVYNWQQEEEKLLDYYQSIFSR